VEFFAGYLLEKSLSVDNLFVFVLLFPQLRHSPQFQHRVLFWGVLGRHRPPWHAHPRGRRRWCNASNWIIASSGPSRLYSWKILFHKDEETEPSTTPWSAGWPGSCP